MSREGGRGVRGSGAFFSFLSIKTFVTFCCFSRYLGTRKERSLAEVDLRGRRGDMPPPPSLPLFFAITQSLVFSNYFEELQTMLFDVELIINIAPLIYVYPDTIKTCLTPSYLLFGRHLLLSSNTTSTVVATVLSSTTDKINRISNHF